MAGSDKKFIYIKGARVNNLKSVDVEIPRNEWIVITGLSGSGKSSLAFDTLYAEGQRRYVESLSSYARQFLGRISKPECDYIKGIPPAIAIEQKVNTRNPRSTVGTSTEIYEYLRLLFARIGKTISPVSGQIVKKHQTSDILNLLKQYPEGTRFTISAPILLPEGRTIVEQLEILHKQGYSRICRGSEMYRIADFLGEYPEDASYLHKSKNIELLVDRLQVSSDPKSLTRIAESVDTAFFEGHETCIIRVFLSEDTEDFVFSKRFEADGITFEEPSDMMFNFNNPLGACPTCEGFGKTMGIDENLVVPNPNLSLVEGAVVCWKGDVMGEWLAEFINNSQKYNFPVHRPYFELTDEEKDLLWNGSKGLYGINDFFKFIQQNIYKIQYRVLQARYRGKTLCPTCQGSRLKKEALYVKVGNKNIAQIVSMSIDEALAFFNELELNETEELIAKRLLIEIKNRLSFLKEVGLGYLTLDRLSNTLSGGESQRINLATSLSSSLVGALYILDEPSIGLHSRDTDLLVNVLRKLQRLGNTVVVVEHDEEIIRSADYMIDIGPNAGRLGGEIVYQGEMNDLPKGSISHTLRYLLHEEEIELPLHRRPWNNYIEILGARKNNLQGVNVKFPLNIITVVSGVSGSGKSTLVRDVFYESVKRGLENYLQANVNCSALEGDLNLIKSIEFVDQNSIGKSSRSNPVTYIGAYDYIRKLFGSLALSKQMGYSAAHFSFNKEGGRCEVCKGEGFVTVEMQFMADLRLLCDECHGKRFKKDILDIVFYEKNIYDILNMTVNEALDFFKNYQDKNTFVPKIIKKLTPLQDVGLGYIKLGQTSSTLSGGENQRVKLASYLAQEKQKATLFVFDEPTTGLHFHDIKTLLKAFNALVDRGHTIVIIEHNLDVIKSADYVIDLGPEGGNKGGELVVCGTPEEVAKNKKSYTGYYLKTKL